MRPLSISVDMQKMIIDPVVNKVNKVNKVNIDSLVRDEPYDKDNKEEGRSICFRSTYMYVCSQSPKGN